MQILFLNPKVENKIFYFDKSSLAKIRHSLEMLSKYNTNLGLPLVREMDRNLFELRIKGIQQVRIFYCYYNSQIVILHSFIKNTQKTPKNELSTVKSKLNLLTEI
mgnify:CR=1 FL=1